jgi:hypothetical protein
MDGGDIFGRCNVSCVDEKSWAKGATLYNYLNTVRAYGITGKLALQEGKRSTTDLEVMRYHGKTDAISKIGDWEE